MKDWGITDRQLRESMPDVLRAFRDAERVLAIGCSPWSQRGTYCLRDQIAVGAARLAGPDG